MKNFILISISVFALFYIGGALMNASFNIAEWDESRETIFSISLLVICAASAMSVIINDNKKS